MVEVTESSFASLQEMQEYVERIGGDVPKVTSMTLTEMGKAGRDRVKEKIPGIFDRPTPWTLGSTLLINSTVTTQESRVFIKELSFNSLAHHITGGMRPPKRFEKRLRSAGVLGAYEFAVPSSRIKRDQYGNVSASTTKRILDALIGGSKSSDKIFVIKESTGGLPPGIFERVGAGSNRDLLPMFLFVRNVSYRKRYPFFELAERGAVDAIPAAVGRAFDSILS